MIKTGVKKLTDICIPKQWKTLSLKDLVENGKYNVYGANGVIGKYNEYNHEYPTILIGCRGTCGKVHMSTPYSYINGNAMCLDDVDETVCLKEYLYYYLKSIDMKKIISGTAQPQITISSLSKLNIILKPLEEQKKIINAMKTLDLLLDEKKHQLNKFDQLIESEFIKMFNKSEKTIRLGDCCDVHARIGWQSLTKKEHMKTGDYLLITGTDFANGEINYSTCVYVSKKRYEMDQHIKLKNDDILITKDGTIGKVAIVHNLPKAATLNAGIFVVRPDNRFNKEYISYVFKGPIFREFINKSKTGAIIKHLNQKYLVEFQIPLPKMYKQLKFANFVEFVGKQKKEIEMQLIRLQELQASLMKEYFN